MTMYSATTDDTIYRGDISESSLHGLDIIGLALATVMTLGPLFATALFG